MQAKELGSSDIHIEIYDEKARVRMRIDGTLVERFEVEKKDYPALVNRIKIKANLDIAEKRLPQDGRIEYKEHGEDFDIRVSVIPTLYGEKMVLRLLNRDATDIQLATLGMKEDQLATYHEGIKKPHGIVLISGPTGSGKTTTLYATLKLLNEERRNIMTVEDPIEYTLEGVNQVQLKEAIGLSFAATLRSFLRQDPDVIMLGEIRDAETAEMAVRAALTGHLVLSTIHTNSAWGTVNRLIDMGVPPFLLANTLNTSVAQRLVRKLCQECAKDDSFNPDLFPSGFTPVRKLESHKVARGCDDCYYTGYSGRAAIYEIIPIDRELTEAVKDSHFSVGELLADRKLSTLADNAFELLASGITSIDEVYPLLITH
jgi:type IV pilus assembly protein PilB